jgi:hypothetical protein
MLMHNTRESALRRDVFHEVLRLWLDESLDAHIGDSETHAGPAWLWVRHGGSHFYLHANATRAGVRAYLREVTVAEGEVEWRPLASASPLGERVAVGDCLATIDGFELYLHPLRH